MQYVILFHLITIVLKVIIIIKFIVVNRHNNIFISANHIFITLNTINDITYPTPSILAILPTSWLRHILKLHTALLCP